jgi:hypothetical protein
MNDRPFTLREANALIPWLNGLFGETRRYLEELHQLRSVARAAGRRSSSVRGPLRPETPEIGVEEQRLRALEEAIKARIEAATALGLQVRRVDGLVDIPTRIDGRPAYLCWRFGEERVTHWHEVSEDDLARQPLPGLAAARPQPRSPTGAHAQARLAPRASPTSGLST